MIRAYLYRGAHRAGRFSVRVADIAEQLREERKSEWFTTWVDSKEYLSMRLDSLYLPGVRVGSQCFIAAAPPQGRAEFPALVEVADD